MTTVVVVVALIVTLVVDVELITGWFYCIGGWEPNSWMVLRWLFPLDRVFQPGGTNTRARTHVGVLVHFLDVHV